MTGEPPLLRVSGLGRRFGGLTALEGVDLVVARGEIAGVIGPNGAGKSTLFGIIAGAIRPSAGDVWLDGRPTTGLAAHAVAWRGISRAFQLVNLFESLTVFENVLIGAERHRHLRGLEIVTRGFGFAARRRRAVARAERALALMEIEHLADKRVPALTYGQQRLVATARAIAAEPSLLMLDEPAAGLSAPERTSLAGAVRRVREGGATVLLIEHNVNFVMHLCDHVAVLHFGRKIADGAPDGVRRDPAVVEAYLGH